MSAFQFQSLGVVAVFTLVSCGTTERFVASDEVGEAPSAISEELELAVAVAQDEQDYSVSGLFQKEHGELLSRVRGFRPDLRISVLHQPDQSLKGEPGEFDLQEYTVDAAFEFPVDPNSWIRVGAHAQRRDFSVSSGLVGADDDESLHETGLILGGGTFLNEGTFLEAQFEPGVYSDFEGGLKSDDWQFFGQALATIKNDDNLYWRVGARVDNTFEDIDLFPLLGGVWLFQENWRLDVMLPRHIEVQWNPTPEFLIDVGLSLTGNEYVVNAPSALGKTRSTWEMTEMRLYTRGTYRFDDRLSAFGRFGGTIAGDYEFNGRFGQSDGTPEGAIFFEVGMGLNW